MINPITQGWIFCHGIITMSPNWSLSLSYFSFKPALFNACSVTWKSAELFMTVNTMSKTCDPRILYFLELVYPLLLESLLKYASKSCLIWVLPNAEVPTSSLYPPLQFLNLSWIDSNLRHHAPKGCGHVFLTQLLKSIKDARRGQESRNMSTADIVNSGCSLPLEGK